MKWWFFAIVLGFISSEAIPIPAGATPPQKEAKPLWHIDYERAKEIARREGKPLFVVFR